MNCRSLAVIIGAGRSGTNMLRDVLCNLPGFGTWPCDEINPIWRHGNLLYPSDEFTPEMARDDVQKYIRGSFDSIRRRYGLQSVVEKTCANSLRVSFVNRVLPEAKYIFIHRNGLDAVASALKRWTAKMELGYQLRKARFVPVTDFPYYALRFFRVRIHRFLSHERRLAFWGPHIDGMKELLEHRPLEEVCALQWKRCVERAVEDFASISPDRVFALGYEDFVRSPEKELERILAFLDYRVEQEILSKAVANVSAANIGKGMTALGVQGARCILPLIRETQGKFGYA